jgi:flagellar biosynthetic protein FliR
MQINVPFATLYAFLLVLARVTAFLAFLPLPGFRGLPDSVRVFLGLVITIAFFPVWPALPSHEVSFGQLAIWAFAESGFGLTAGLAVAFLTEGFQVAAQSIGLEAGYNYASTINPASDADSSILEILAMFTSSLLMFTLGIDRELIRILALSFERFPAGSWAPSLQSMDGILRLGGGMLSLGLRFALPVIALLLLIDVAFGLLGRIQQQLQLLSLAFPAKMAAAVALLAILAPTMSRLIEISASHTLATLRQVVTQAR